MVPESDHVTASGSSRQLSCCAGNDNQRRSAPRPPLAAAKQKSNGRSPMTRSGKVVFGEMDEVVFGVPAAEAIPQQMDRLGARRAMLMVSGTLNRTTDEITKIRSALGERCVAVFDAMPAHSPRQAVV